MKALSDAELKDKTREFKERLKELAMEPPISPRPIKPAVRCCVCIVCPPCFCKYSTANRMLFSDNIKCIISDVLVNRFSNPAAYFSEKHRDDPAGNRKQERL